MQYCFYIHTHIWNHYTATAAWLLLLTPDALLWDGIPLSWKRPWDILKVVSDKSRMTAVRS